MSDSHKSDEESGHLRVFTKEPLRERGDPAANASFLTVRSSYATSNDGNSHRRLAPHSVLYSGHSGEEAKCERLDALLRRSVCMI